MVEIEFHKYPKMKNSYAIQYNSGDGYVYASSQLESLAVVTTPQTRIGNRIDLLGIRINHKLS